MKSPFPCNLPTTAKPQDGGGFGKRPVGSHSQPTQACYHFLNILNVPDQLESTPLVKYHIVTLGCPKNSVDSEGMDAILQARGHIAVEEQDEADVIIVNTCGFIAEARTEALGVLHDIAKQKHPTQYLIGAGCMVQSHEHLIRAIPGVDTTLSTRQWTTIAEVVESPWRYGTCQRQRQPSPASLPSPSSIASSEQSSCERSPSYRDWRTTPIRRTGGDVSAYVKISDGCNIRCAFCTIPDIKGNMRSKEPDDVVQEVRELVERGVEEIVLVAQHLTDYGRDLGMKEGLATLLERISAILPTTTWLRLMYAYPIGITPRLIETMVNTPQICAYLDLPLQHAHPNTLRRMNRPTDVERTKETIAKLRDALPQIALRSTFIVGFPGETEEEFVTLLDFLDEMQFDWVGAFRYSKEEATPAADLPDQKNTRLINQRWHRVMQQQQPISLARNQQWVGKDLEVLIEGQGITDDGQTLVVGRSFREAPGIDGQLLLWGDAPIGTRVQAHIIDATPYDLWGELNQYPAVVE